MKHLHHSKTAFRDPLSRWYLGVFTLAVLSLTYALYYYLQQQTWDNFNFGVSQLAEEMLDEVMDLRDDLDLEDFENIVWTDSLREKFKSGIELELVDESYDNKLEDAGYVRLSNLISAELIYQSEEIAEQQIRFFDPSDNIWGYRTFSGRSENGDSLKGIGYVGIRTTKLYFIGIIPPADHFLSNREARLPYEQAIYEITESFDRVADSLFLEGTAELAELMQNLSSWVYVYIYNDDRLLWSTMPVTKKELYIPQLADQPDLKGMFAENLSKEYLFDLYDKDGNNYRQFTLLHDIVPNYLYRVDLAIRTDSIQNRLNYLALYFFLGALTLVLIVWGGGRILLRRALKPVDEIIASVNEITTSNFEKRLPLKGSDNEITRLVVTFNKLLDRLAESFVMQKAFIADASHELRTPLSIMLSDLETAAKNIDKRSPARISINNFIGEIERMARIVDDLNLLSKQDSGQIQIYKKPVRLDDVLLNTVSRCQILAGEKNIKLVIEDAEITEYTGDEELLIRALSNLVHNAIKYADEKSTVAINLYLRDGWACLSVSDAGAGIAAEHQEKIFDRFYRVDSSRSRETGGSGLGLAITKWICEIHGGTISVSSEPGKGSVFTMDLPLNV